MKERPSEDIAEIFTVAMAATAAAESHVDSSSPEFLRFLTSRLLEFRLV